MNKYETEMQKRINKALRDEVSASIFYYKVGNFISDLEAAEEILDHAKEEMEHFADIIKYSTSHGIICQVELDKSVTEFFVEDDKKLVEKIQELEKLAISDYRDNAKFAEDNGDLESMEFWKSLMEKEIEHFDDIAPKLKQSRKLGESYFLKELTNV
jgi:ferritin